ncbi:energy transducer TonB [Kordia sp.]|uniref:energy transducer TonB n=1 Tax=Kordia sp. TaxID=1965332 RepID=UPI0025C5B429|nr:energy transducer TonB [Kordia sp.]MCH2192985.1 energy transducer TonB [Kordia sp.]
MKNATHNKDVNANGVRESHLAKKNNLKGEKNSLLRFSVSLMLSLFIVYTIFQVKTVDAAPKVAEVEDVLEDDMTYVPVFQEEVVVVKQLKPEPVVQTELIIDKIKEVENDHKDLKETVLKTTVEPKEVTSLIDVSTVEVEDPVEIPEEVPFAFIEDAPIYPGCEKFKSKAKRKKCMSEKIDKLIQRKFDADLANELGLDEGIKRINVLFVIDENGNVTGIQSRAPHPKLKKEAERVIKLLPKMEPGKQRNKNVKVKYTLPIVFRVN